MLARATPAELARIPRIRAEFRPWRPLAFELQRRGYAARGWVLPGSSASVLHGRWPSCGVAEKARIGRDLFRSADDPPAAKPATPLLSLRWTFRAKRACVVITDAEPDRLAPLTPPAPIGLRGVWVVAARCCASPPARCCADALERSFACPSAKLRAPSRRGLHPRSGRRRPAAVSPRGERIRSRRGCWHCSADRAAPPSPPSRAPPAGSRTRCAPSWPPWCARSSGCGWNRRRRTASACIGLLPARLPAMPRACRVRSHAGALENPAAIEAEIAHLRSLALDALRRHWRVIFGRTPPADLSKDLLGRMIAYRLQERAFGGLDRESLRFLHGLARHGGPPRRRLKPGTVLVRDYQGQRHTVTVVSDGFDWQGATYPSLSAIARAITGTAWSGPRFFALARGNGAPARRNKNASAREGRDGSQPARGMNASEMNTRIFAPANSPACVNLKP